MAAQINGIQGPVQPDIFTRVRTKERVNAVSGGSRIVCVIGEGESEEVLIASAQGGGRDGVNADFSGFNSPDGRHFNLSKLDLVENRTRILKNGVPLVVLEASITNQPFDSRYDVRVDPATGRVELQSAHLEDFGTDSLGNTLWFYANSGNAGNGRVSIDGDSLVDTNAPAETWTIRCVSNIKDGSGNPIPGEARFTVSGTVSGQVKDANGNVIVWKSDGETVSNGILSFSIVEGSVAFEVGDRFAVKVNSGVLSAGDELVARYIANEDLNDPETFFSPQDAFVKHGQPSETNTLSLGVQMAFENGAVRVTAVQAKPPVPRKTSVTLIQADDLLTDESEGASGGSDLKDTVFPLPFGSLPDVDSKVNVFVVEPNGAETQLLLNKEEFYNSSYSTTALAYSGFVSGATSSAYTVFQAAQVEQDGNDGYAEALSATELYFSSPTAAFEADRNTAGEGDVGKKLIVLAPAEVAGTYTVETVGDGYGDVTLLTASLDSGSIAGGAGVVIDGYVEWQLVDSADQGAYFAITDDVATNYLTEGKGLRVSYVDNRDADFFDTNWTEALEATEEVDVQFICPLPRATVSNIFQATKVHVEQMSNIVNQRERIAIFGALTGLTPDHLTGKSAAAVEDIGVLEGIQGDDVEEILNGNIEDLANYSVANAFGDSFRCIYLWPDQIVRNIAGTNTALPGYFMSPALGGFLSGQTNIAQPPTFKTLAGFNILRDRVARRPIKNELSGAGVLVVEPIAGGGRMLHAKTTTQSAAPEEEEISVVGIRDQVARAVRASLRPFVGRINSPTLIPELNKGIGKLLRALVSQGLLAGFGSITVQRNAVEPRQIDISLEINPNSPINWVFVDMTVSL